VARLVGLLRGVNVGKHNRVRMAELRRVIEELGYEDVRTLLQSGNVVFTTSDAASAAETKLRAAVKQELGLDVVILVRTRAELAAAVERNPLAEHASDPKRHLVVFLEAKPAARALDGVDAAEYERERFALHGRELYMWLPDGIYPAKLPKVLTDKRLGVASTARNWATVEKLLALADAD